MKKYTLIILLNLIVSSCLLVASAGADPCKEGQEILGFALHATRQDDGQGLAIAEISPLTPGSQAGLRQGDVLEQVNSWPIRDCKSYRKAVQDAQTQQKAILLLVSRKGERRPIFIEPEIWKRAVEKKEDEQAVTNLQTMLSAPLPEGIKVQTEKMGDQALGILRTVESLAVLPGPFSIYERSVREARNQIRALDRQSQGEAEKRVVAGVRVLLGYYETARAIRQYKLDYVRTERKDIRTGRAESFASETVPYFYDSSVTEWISKYPFLRASIKDSPRKFGPDVLDFIERPGAWDPDNAVRLLWRHARNETNKFAQWVNGQRGK